MNEFFKDANILQKFWNGLSEAIPYINNCYDKNGTLHLLTDNPAQIFLREDNTVHLGNKLSVFIKGFAVSFWTGLDISNKSARGEVALYFDKPSNNPGFIDLLKKHKGWQYSGPKTVTDGFRLVCKKRIDLTAEDWLNFIVEPLNVLL